MQAGTLVMMVLVLGILWGGFALLLAHSMNVEKRRQSNASSADGGDHD